MKSYTENGKQVICLEGKIDSKNAAAVEKELMALIDGTDGGFLIDAGELTYISSAGLRVLMKVDARQEGKITIRNVLPDVYEIFDMTGFVELFDIRKKMKEISVEGCEVIGEGFFGTVYRIDPETIVKVYNSPDCMDIIENEKKMAKLAFVNGLPTAISYDIVRVGDGYGSVFELLNARSFNDLVKSEPDRIDEILDIYVGFLRKIHGIRIGGGVLPRAKDLYLGYLEKIAHALPEGLTERLKGLFSAVPDDDRVVHGDFQMKNVLLVDDEPMLIDMDTLSAGHPIFDLAALYVTYSVFAEDEPDNPMNFLGISDELRAHICDGIFRRYFEGEGEQALAEKLDRIRVAAYVRFLFIILSSSLKDSELGQTRIRHSTEHLEELLGRVDELCF